MVAFNFFRLMVTNQICSTMNYDSAYRPMHSKLEYHLRGWRPHSCAKGTRGNVLSTREQLGGLMRRLWRSKPQLSITFDRLGVFWSVEPIIQASPLLVLIQLSQ